jgi:3-methyladenine DNA glycosylase AlkD
VAASTRLIRAVRQALRAAADPAKALAMQAYMKSEMPYRGVQSTPLRLALRPLFAVHHLAGFVDWRDTVLALWREARYREERYAAIELAGHSSSQPFQTMAALPVYEEMIVSGAWWDLVDALASHLIGGLLRLYPRDMAAILRGWATGDDIWKRRAAILAQLGFKSDTDCVLLYDCIRPSLGRPEFFLRKGIGWALREYSKTNASEVRRYVRRNAKLLSPLSQREALKRLNAKPAAR